MVNSKWRASSLNIGKITAITDNTATDPAIAATLFPLPHFMSIGATVKAVAQFADAAHLCDTCLNMVLTSSLVQELYGELSLIKLYA